VNRIDRLLAIILELQDRKQLRAEDLAAIFEVSKRTIYRDIQALSEAGVPLISRNRSTFWVTSSLSENPTYTENYPAKC
jgi:predicted DNA-binding transcriptional regulator YafY